MAKKHERDFQANLVKELKAMFPGCYIFKLPANYKSGIPDLLILFGKYWATLECKANKKAKHRPLQDYHVEKLNKMSFSRFIFPENKQEVLNDLQQAFGIKGKTCTIQSFPAGVAKVRRRKTS